MYLNCHSWYSLRYGTFSVEALCKLAQSNGISALALTDINNTSACLSFLKTAPQFDISPLTGIDFRNGVQQQYVGIATNNQGFFSLNEFLSQHLQREKDFPEQAPELSDCYFIYPFEQIVKLKKINFSQNEFIGISTESLRKLKFSDYQNLKDRLVVLQTVSFRSKRDFNAHRLLRAIDNNTLLSKLPKSEQGDFWQQMIPLEDLEAEFRDFQHILENTRRLMNSCQMSFGFGKARINRNLQVYSNSKEEDIVLLKKLVFDNLSSRYPHAGTEIQLRVERELEAIIGLNFVPYFLINYDIIQYARSKNFPYLGRGSGANSIVAYILGITNVDPIELDLYFERFINAYRNSPPDFDIDFSWKDRNDVTAYIFNRFKHTALLTTYVTFKRRAVCRELGKVFGLPKEQIDKLSAGYFDYNELDELEKLVIQYSSLIEGFPNYLSVHSGGIIILNEPVYNYAATFLPPKGFETIQIDMNISEDVGIHKFDILAQRGLSKITDAIEIIKQNQPEAEIKDIEKVSIFKEDPKINYLLKTGDCMGVFYIESPAMRGLFIKLQTDNYLNLVAASSIIRPGVSNGGMKEEYIKRHRDVERRKQAHPVMYEIMPDTYGVMVYQEDVMKVAHYFAGLSFDDADVLRRGMSGKKTSKGQIEKLQLKFRENCLKKGYNEDLITEVWEQIASFAGYAFPKGHSASYAVESYQSLYLKCYFPLEFMVAALNNGGGFYDAETYIQEIQKCGGKIHAPCINKSDHPTVIYGKDIYLGFGYIKELETNVVQQILENRQFFGEFCSFEDFIDRVVISVEQLRLLLKINAFRFTRIDKHELLWKAYFKLNNAKNKPIQEVLFRAQHRDFTLPQFRQSQLVETYDQITLLGFSLYNNFDLLKNQMQASVKTSELKNHIGKEVLIYGDLITISTTRTSTNRYMYFGTFYDAEGNIFDTVHFPAVADKFPVRSKGIYRCFGKVAYELGHISIEVKWIKKEEVIVDPRIYEPEFRPVNLE